VLGNYTSSFESIFVNEFFSKIQIEFKMSQISGNSIPSVKLRQILIGGWIPQAVYVAAKLNIADYLKHEPKSINELALATFTHAPSLYRILRTLCSVGIFEEKQDQFFGLTPISECLQSDIPNSLRSLAVMYGESFHFQPWANILAAVKTGKSAFECTFGIDLFQYMEQNSEANQIFNDTMISLSTLVNIAIVTGYDYSRINNLVDIGSGKGTLTLPLLRANPKMQAILFDLPHVIEEAIETINSENLTDRCTLVSGDFFESIPTGSDLYILKHILHDWDDQRSINILKNCHQAMTSYSKLLIMERIVPLGNEPSPAKLNDLEMMVLTPSGRERTELEFKALLQASGFKLVKIYPTDSPLFIIEAVCA
jgi:O-methyltransferase domain